MRERGLKCRRCFPHQMYTSVAPHAGAWIEISQVYNRVSVEFLSLPMRERGLKLDYPDASDSSKGRSPCGSVD